MGICMRYTRSEFDAEDLLQDIFIKIFDKIQTYKGEGSFEGWIRRLTVNTILVFLKRKSREMKWNTIETIEETEVSLDNIIDQMSGEELFDLINKLPEGCRFVFNLYIVEGYNHKEIAEILKISEGTSKSQYSYAKKLLQKALIDIKGSEVGI